MVDCPSIAGIEFDEKSRKGLKRLREIDEFADLLPTFVSAGVFITIFAKSGPGTASYNIKQTDWETFAKALRAVPDIKRNRIELLAGQQVLDHQFDPKQKEFWMAVYNGCQLN